MKKKKIIINHFNFTYLLCSEYLRPMIINFIKCYYMYYGYLKNYNNDSNYLPNINGTMPYKINK